MGRILIADDNIVSVKDTCLNHASHQLQHKTLSCQQGCSRDSLLNIFHCQYWLTAVTRPTRARKSLEYCADRTHHDINSSILSDSRRMNPSSSSLFKWNERLKVIQTTNLPILSRWRVAASFIDAESLKEFLAVCSRAEHLAIRVPPKNTILYIGSTAETQKHIKCTKWVDIRIRFAANVHCNNIIRAAKAYAVESIL